MTMTANIENDRPPWLRAQLDMLTPGNLTLIAFEAAERVMRAARDREISIDLDRKRLLQA
jgi:hypothetical protein